MGSFPDAAECANRALTFALGEKERKALLAELGDDARLYAQSIAAIALWHAGDEARSRRLYQDTVVEVRRIESPYVRAVTIFLANILLDYVGDCKLVAEGADELVKLSLEFGMSWWLGAGLMRRGYARCQLTGGRDGLADLEEGYRLWQEGAAGGVPYWNYLSAKLHVCLRDYAAASELITNGLDHADRVDEPRAGRRSCIGCARRSC